ncbi:MAG: MerR family transcriptional regulator [Acidobacteria bacterium]|nr:MerR family transcriptional regulator [Acidobacteriota bacterium]
MQVNNKKTLLYPIRAVAKQTGISIDTLRAWEKRYQVVVPQRDERGRLYTEADMRRLRLLNAAVEKGHAIGRLAALSNEDLEALVLETPLIAEVPAAKETEIIKRQNTAAASDSVSILGSVIDAVGRLDYAEAERELSLLAAVLPPRELVHNVALPLMRQVGEAWHTGKLGIAQEHMATSLLRNLLGGLIPLHRRAAPKGKLLFATPSGEHHEFGILVSAMLAAGGGMGIVYLGTNLPGEEIVAAAQKTAPLAVVLGYVGANGAKAGLAEIEGVAHKLPAQIELWIGGTRNIPIIEELRKTRALLIEDFLLFEQHLMRLGARF